MGPSKVKLAEIRLTSYSDPSVYDPSEVTIPGHLSPLFHLPRTFIVLAIHFYARAVPLTLTVGSASGLSTVEWAPDALRASVCAVAVKAQDSFAIVDAMAASIDIITQPPPLM
jgi:hypothetical protein